MLTLGKEMSLLMIKAPFNSNDQFLYLNDNPRKKQLGIFKIHMAPPKLYLDNNIMNPGITFYK
jgi:hypothetical protein